MSDFANFQKNVDHYAHFAPQTVVRLSYTDSEHLVFCRTKKNELNLQRDVEGQIFYYHSQDDAEKEAKEWFSSLNLVDKQILYVYGVGLGYYYAAAKEWLKKDKRRHMVFLEDDLAVISRLFETSMGYQILHDKQVQLHHFQSLEKDKALFGSLCWNFIQQPLAVSALKLYAQHGQERLSKLDYKLNFDASHQSDLIEEYLNYGALFYRNFYANLLELPKSYLGDHLFGKFPQIPAIICGAGPSLQKHFSLLKTLENRALIFSGGSSLNALTSHGILPHFGAGVDPNETQYERLKGNTGFEVPFFYRNRMHYQAFKSIPGPRLYLTGAGGYDTADWFEERLKIKGKFLDEGNNVVNLCLEIANALGCNPIIFVGMDLAYTGMKTYAPGIIEDNVFDQKATQEVQNRTFQMDDINGNPVYTEWKWVAEAEWVTEYVKDHPEVTIFNATEGGIGFLNVPNVTLEGVVKDYLTRTYDLRSRVHEEIQNSALKNVTKNKILKLMKELLMSLERCDHFLEGLLEERDQTKKSIKENGALISADTGKKALLESDLMEEIGYRYVLDIFNTMQARMTFHDFQKLQTMKKRKPSARQELKQLEMDKKRYRFLKKACFVNAYFIQEAMRQS